MDRGVEKLILDNTDLVYFVLRKLNMTIDDDLVSEGMLALVQAAQKFNPELGIQFSTYAVSWIKGRVKTYLTIKHPLVKPSRRDGKYAEVQISTDEEIIAVLNAPDDNVESNLIVNDFISKLNYKEQYIVNGLLTNKTQQQLGDDLHVTQAQISKLIRVIRYKYMKYSMDARTLN